MHRQNQSQNEEHRLRSLVQSIPKSVMAGKLLKNKLTKLGLMMLGIIAILILIWLSPSNAELRQHILYPLTVCILIQGINKLLAHCKEDQNK